MVTAKARATSAVDPAIVDAVDELGRVRGQIDKLQGRERELKDLILGAAGSVEVEGRIYRAKITTSTRWSLNLQAARKELGSEWCDRNSTMATVRSLKISPRADVIEAAARLAA